MSPSSRALALRFYDRDGDKIGKVDHLFVDENDQLEYVGVKTAFLGLSGPSLISREVARVNEDVRKEEIDIDDETTGRRDE